jgi:uncharacterized membrane protein YozB (DUF420 family)
MKQSERPFRERTVVALAILCQTLIAIVAMTLLTVFPANAQDSIMEVDSIPTVKRVPLRFQPLSECDIVTQNWFAKKAARKDDRFVALADSINIAYHKEINKRAARLAASTQSYRFTGGNVIVVQTVGSTTYVR